MGVKTIQRDSVYLAVEVKDPIAAYKLFKGMGSSLVVINQDLTGISFDAGPLFCSDTMIKGHVSKFVAASTVDSLVSSLRGLTYKEVKEITTLCTSKYGEFTSSSIRKARNYYYKPAEGLQEI